MTGEEYSQAQFSTRRDWTKSSKSKSLSVFSCEQLQIQGTWTICRIRNYLKWPSRNNKWFEVTNDNTNFPMSDCGEHAHNLVQSLRFQETYRPFRKYYSVFSQHLVWKIFNVFMKWEFTNALHDNSIPYKV